MSLKATIDVAGAQLTLDAPDNKALVKELAFWSGLPNTCPVCAAPVFLVFRIAKEFSFYGMRCHGNPSHDTNFGLHKKDESFFYKGHGSWKVVQYGQDEHDGEGYGDTTEGQEAPSCTACGAEITPGQATLSQNKFGAALCLKHQPAENVKKTETIAGPPPVAGPPKSTDPPASKQERDQCLEWLNYASSQGYLQPGEEQSFGTEVADATTPRSRIVAICKDLSDRHAAAQKA